MTSTIRPVTIAIDHMVRSINFIRSQNVNIAAASLLLVALVLAPNAALNIAMILGLALLPRMPIVAALLTVSLAIDALGAAQIVAGYGRAWGTFASHNWFGYYAVTHCFLAFASRGRLRKLSSMTAVSNGIAVFLSLSRTSIMAFGLGMTIALLSSRRPRWAIGIPLVLSLTLAILIPRSDMLAFRLSVWHLGLNAALAHPWLGWRGGIMLLGSPGFYNAPLDWTLMTGLVGLVVAAIAFVVAWRANPSMRPLLAAWLVNGLAISTTLPASLPLLAVLRRG